MILNGETETALSIHYILDHGIDTGDLIQQYPFDIPADAYPIDIYRIASGIILERCPSVVSMIADGSAPSIRQNAERSTYFPRLYTLTDGCLRFDLSPSEFERFVRAFGWPYAGPHCSYGNQTLRVARCRVLEEPGHYHPFTNGLVIHRDTDAGTVQVIVGGGVVEIISLRDGNDEVPAADRLRTSRRLSVRPGTL